jgi:hypothetical protein
MNFAAALKNKMIQPCSGGLEPAGASLRRSAGRFSLRESRHVCAGASGRHRTMDLTSSRSADETTRAGRVDCTSTRYGLSRPGQGGPKS